MNKIKFLAALFIALLPETAFTQTASDYVITGSGEQFTVTKNGTELPLTTQPCMMYALCPVLTTIRNDASGSDVSIRFGDGSVLDIEYFQRALFNVGSEWGNITLSGKITSKLGASGDQECGGTVVIDREVSVTSTADIANTYEYENSGGSAICIDGGVLKIVGGTVESTSKGYAIQTQMRGSTVILGGSPTITGRIQVPKGKLSVADGFAPEGKKYTLTMSGTAGDVAVVGGASFASSFILASGNFSLAASGNDLVFAVPTSSSSTHVSSSSSTIKSSSSVAPSSSSAVKSSSSAVPSSSSSYDTTPIAHYTPPTHSEIPTYYTMKGEPVGSTKPAKPGVYLVKQGSSVRKIVVR
ncbi:MAG: hypothetical protein LBQ76_06040 [Candidatus Fibromonas sp.]|jgi:hypothetical protein|nr:hypothetical protein [Candidatus Fibromonas sp.]